MPLKLYLIFFIMRYCDGGVGEAPLSRGDIHANLSHKFTQYRLLVASSIVLRWGRLALLRHAIPLAIYIGTRAKALCLSLAAVGNVGCKNKSLLLPLQSADRCYYALLAL